MGIHSVPLSHWEHVFCVYLGVKLTGIDLDVQRVLVETIQPSAMVIDLIESTGPRAVLLGLGTASETSGEIQHYCFLLLINSLIKGLGMSCLCNI